MWARDASHVASAALGAYAFSEIAARVVGDAVAPDTARWLTLVALAVVAAAFALVARADARRARADSAEAERRARRDARFRAAVLERAARRDPSRDPEDATRVDCLAALARVVDAGFSLGDGGARFFVPDPSPGSPPLLATPARREAARAFAAKASEARRIPKDDKPRKDAAGDGFARRVAPPASFTAEDVADGAVVLSRALAGRDDPIEVAVSTDVSRVLVSGTREALVGFEVASTTTRSSTTTTTTSAPPSFAAGGCSLDPRDGADRVARVAAMLIDLARAQASRVLREGEPRRVANEGRPCVVRLRLETGREKRRVLGVLGDAAGHGRARRDVGNGNQGARRTRVGDSRDERVTRDATWFDVRLVASLVAPRDARRVPREEQKRQSREYEPRTETAELDSEEERAFSFRGNGVDVGDVDALDASLTRAALAATASALGGSFKREPATGPDAVGDGFACAFPLLAHSALPFGEDDDDDADAESFRLDPKLPELSFPANLERTLRDTPGNGVRNPTTTRLEAVFHPSVSSGRRAHFRRILETYPGARVTTAKTAEAAEAAAAAALRAGSFALVVCASPTGLETTAAARAAVAAVAARETLVAAAAAADVRGVDAGRRGAALLLAAFGGDLDAACDAAREASADAGAGDDDESRGGPETNSQTRRASPASRLAATPESPGEDETRDETSHRAPFCSSFEFVAAASTATSEEIHAALCAALRRGAEAAAAAAAADAAARRERAAAVSARRASSAAPGGVRSRRLSDRSDDGEFAEIRGNRSRAPSARASLETPHAGDGSPAYGHFAENGKNEFQETPRAADASERSAANDAVVDAVLAAVADAASPPSLPEKKTGSDGGAEPHALPGSPPRVSGEAPGESLEGMRVLVVDDNHFQLRVVKASLKRSGVELDAAVHGREAVELFEKRLKAIRDVGFDDAEDRLATTKPPYDVILMDSMMPVMDGCAATIEIRAAERAFRTTLPAALLEPGGTFERETMIIGLSAEAGPEYEAGAREAGMDGALGKPCRPEALRDALRQVNQGTFNSWKASSKRGTLHF